MLKIGLFKSSEKQQDSNENIIRKSCYSGIDELPIFNWSEINKKGDLSLLLKEKKELTAVEIPILSKIFKEFYDVYLSEFGLTDKAQEIFDLKVRYLENLCAYLQGDKSIQTFIDIDKFELDKITQDKQEGISIWELKSRMEVILKINIDVKKCSVIEFYNYLKLVSEITDKK